MDYKKLKRAYRIVSITKSEKPVLDFLQENGDRFNVTELMIRFRIEQCLISLILTNLYKKGYLIREKEGKNVYYSANYAFIYKVNMATKKLNYY